MSNTDVAKLIPTRPESELAQDFKRRLIEAHAPLLVLFDEIKAAGLEPAVNVGPGPLGNYVITNLAIMKRL